MIVMGCDMPEQMGLDGATVTMSIEKYSPTALQTKLTEPTVYFTLSVCGMGLADQVNQVGIAAQVRLEQFRSGALQVGDTYLFLDCANKALWTFKRCAR